MFSNGKLFWNSFPRLVQQLLKRFDRNFLAEKEIQIKEEADGLFVIEWKKTGFENNLWIGVV